MFGPAINVNEVEHRLADLRKRHQAALNGREYGELTTEEKSVCNNILAQIGHANEQLREHKAGAYFDTNKQPGEFRLIGSGGKTELENGTGVADPRFRFAGAA